MQVCQVINVTTKEIIKEFPRAEHQAAYNLMVDVCSGRVPGHSSAIVHTTAPEAAQ